MFNTESAIFPIKLTRIRVVKRNRYCNKYTEIIGLKLSMGSNLEKNYNIAIINFLAKIIIIGYT